MKNKPEEKQENIPQHCEQIFLNSLHNSQQMVQIYLISGVRLIGTVVSSDEYTILLSTKLGGTQMLYKHSITTICAFREGN